MAVKGRVLGSTRLHDVASLVTPDTIVRWYRTLVAQKYDGSAHRGPGRPLTLTGLARHHVFFVMALRTRRVEIAGITSLPGGAWMGQLARNLTDAADGFLRDT